MGCTQGSPSPRHTRHSHTASHRQTFVCVRKGMAGNRRVIGGSDLMALAPASGNPGPARCKMQEGRLSSRLLWAHLLLLRAHCPQCRRCLVVRLLSTLCQTSNVDGAGWDRHWSKQLLNGPLGQPDAASGPMSAAPCIVQLCVGLHQQSTSTAVAFVLQRWPCGANNKRPHMSVKEDTRDVRASGSMSEHICADAKSAANDPRTRAQIPLPPVT